MAEKKNALAELAKRLRNGLYINSNDNRFDGPVIVRTLDANDVLAAQRIVAELAKVEERKEYATKISLSDATVLLRRNLSEMYYKCREIAEEGSK